MKAFTFCPTAPFRALPPRARTRSTSSRVSASRSTATSGPFPERNTAWVGSRSSRRRVATFIPTRVLPAPGTPVTKTTSFVPPARASSMIPSTRAEVTDRFLAPASFLEMASTEWSRYRARAAWTMVGVGR